MSNINREALLKAAQGLLSSSENDESSEEERHRSRSPVRKRSRSEKRSKHSKQNKKPKEQHGKHHKRSEQDKIRELERKAAAIGATNLASRVPRTLGNFSAAAGSAAGDAAVLDTVGDSNNAVFESLYAGSVPRYHRLDPLNLVSARNSWQTQLQQADKDAGNTQANRYYKGRNILAERSRQTKRIQLSDIRPQKIPTTQQQQQQQQGLAPSSSNTITNNNTWMSLLAGIPQQTSDQFMSGPDQIQQQQQQQQAHGTAASSSSSRKLAIPAPAFIPLDPPEALVQAAAAAAGDGDLDLRPPEIGGSSSRRHQKIDPELLIQEAGLTADECVLKATRSWNVAVRETPHDEALWLDFAAFQHTAAKMLQQHRGRSDAAAAATAEKQVSVLTRGLSHNPQSQQLLLALLRTYALIAPDQTALEDKWQGVLARQPGSWILWREYLEHRTTSFASFSVSSLQQSYLAAIHALHLDLLATRRKAAAAHKQQQQQQQGRSLNMLPKFTQQQLQQMSPAAAAAAAAGSSGAGGRAAAAAAAMGVCCREEELELQVVQLLLALMYHELVAGHTEQVVARIQALLEYHLFQPPTPPGGAAALLRMFKAFWDSSAPLIGNQGSRGWAYWCCWHAMGLEQPTAAAAAEVEEAGQTTREEPAGWTGWFEVPQQQQQQQQQQEEEVKEGDQAEEAAATKAHRKHRSSKDTGPEAGNSDQAGSDEPSGSEDSQGPLSDDEAAAAAATGDDPEESELDEVDLMLQLGIQLEEQLQEVERQGLPTHIVKRWAQGEATRSSSHWQPLYPTKQQQQQADGEADMTDQASSVTFDSIQPMVFPIRSITALKRLVLGSLELLGAPLGAWCSSNSPTPLQQLSPKVPDSVTGVTTGPRIPGTLVAPSGTSGATVHHWSDAAADGLAGPGVTLPAAAAGASGAPANRQQQQQQQQQQQRQVSWYMASDDRWQFLVSLLDRLVTGGPCSSWPELCSALLLLHARKPSDTAAAAAAAAANGSSAKGDPAQLPPQHSSSQHLMLLTIDGAAVASSSSSSSSSSWPSQQQVAAVRAAAKQLLGDQRDNLLLYDAYGCCESAMGQTKTARKVLGSALTLATAAAAASSSGSDPAAAAAAAAVPVLAMHLAQVEISAGGTGCWDRAHAAVHACLTSQVFAPAAAAAAGGSTRAAASADQPQQQQQQQQGLLAESSLIKARRGFQDQITQLISTDGGSLTAAAAATIAAAAIFELTVGILTDRAASGVAAAAALYKQALAAVPAGIRAASVHHELLQALYCHMLVAAAVGAVNQLVPPPAAAAAAGSSSSSSSIGGQAAAALMAAVSPARARSALTSALSLNPSSKVLLNLQIWLDHSCYTLAGLRRQLAALTELNPSPSLWATALQAEGLRPGGRVRLRALFERALAAPTPQQWQQQQQHVRRQQQQRSGFQQQQQQIKDSIKRQDLAQQQQFQDCTAATRSPVLLDLAVQDGYRGFGSCSAIWEQYMQYELDLGRPENARKLFLRAVHECPGFKGLWLSGFGALCDGMQPREASGLMSAMQERELAVRTDVYEVLLAEMAEKQQ